MHGHCADPYAHLLRIFPPDARFISASHLTRTEYQKIYEYFTAPMNRSPASTFKLDSWQYPAVILPTWLYTSWMRFPPQILGLHSTSKRSTSLHTQAWVGGLDQVDRSQWTIYPFRTLYCHPGVSRNCSCIATRLGALMRKQL